MKVTWNLPDGSAVAATIDYGQNLMEAAVAQNVQGVVGECGGTLSCATCHVYVDDAWADKTGEVGDFEDAMLDMADGDRRSNSRLSCQIEAHPDLDGLVLAVPEA
ncbi:2Fe-2S iron-sulfur cluster binding domain-containing protein [Parasedimentitalea maritima]|uniref:2Fe-2S iron-sulfur cluster binding domain-containing protein n=2 Tax=Parasedimentitalea TaxID=2738399 RepID=A0A6L6WB19_9RHOB|nr:MULTISPECIES: 2Fe-2S iron-sulfur cluster-binding protein [Zongyanglinia]KAE9632743.1 2Fe-2S iron-sulfur cluster binding domain-containing protein [Zongyanglinia marina]MVO15013.1 2Fe-2S iron-sulfur cluster binding domain-containing protein [Zongyanglinia huanghaiensis]TLP69249.1 2Fe-2S iron-sulfur cluster binding domain-containing protein [Zongyanglinia marina]